MARLARTCLRYTTDRVTGAVNCEIAAYRERRLRSALLKNAAPRPLQIKRVYIRLHALSYLACFKPETIRTVFMAMMRRA